MARTSPALTEFPMIVYDKLMALEIEPVVQVYAPKDCMLYALGVGLGHDPMNEDELAFVYEKNLKALPTMATRSHAIRIPASTGCSWSTASRVFRCGVHSRARALSSGAPASSR
jgi:hypothetical protein